MDINRRSLLALLGSGSALAFPGPSFAREQPRAVAFAHGVASGDPATDGAVIWTRASAEEGFAGDIALTWFVAATPEADPLLHGEVLARGAADHTAKVEVAGLEPGREYHYWFTAPGAARSTVGRFRTLPVGALDRLVLAVASCQLFSGGYYNAWADMAALPELDAIVFLGDYIYEYGAEGYGADVGGRLGRLPDPPVEIVTLADYRRRHAQVKADPDMQAAHARAAFICVWDDHEVANDGWTGGAGNHQAEREGDWTARKAVAMQAYFEWMPIRDPDPLRTHEAIFRSFEFGDLVTLAMLETRLLARDQQISMGGVVPSPERLAELLAERDRPERELLGGPQRRWLEEVLADSVEGRKPWQVLGNQIVMARLAGPDIEAIAGADEFARLRHGLPSSARDQIDRMLTGFRAGVPFNLDIWDGYPAARERLYASFAKAGTRPLVLSGDSHAAWANNLADASGQLAAIEVGCTAITSPSYGNTIPGFGAFVEAANPEVAFNDQDNKGYSLLTFTRDAVRADYVAVSTVMERAFERRIAASFTATPERDSRLVRA